MPSTNLTDVNVERATLLYILLRNKNLNISKILSDRILHMIQDKTAKTKLAHPSLISHLCVLAGLEISDDEELDIAPASYMTHGTFHSFRKEAKEREVLRAVELPSEILCTQSPRMLPRAPEILHPQHLLPASSSTHLAGSSSVAPPPPAAQVPLYEDSPIILDIQRQLRDLTTQSRRQTRQLRLQTRRSEDQARQSAHQTRLIEYQTRMMEDQCRQTAIQTSPYRYHFTPAVFDSGDGQPSHIADTVMDEDEAADDDDEEADD